MSEERAKRKLSAILSADVKGYSRLMGADELATVRTLEDYRQTMSAIIQQFRGRVVDSPGDNLLAEFASVVDAMESAVEIQKALKARNEELPEDRRMEFRIGINLGDVIEEGDRIYGDGINIAARIEGLAEGGGICISGNVYDQVKNKLHLDYENLGEHTVKNISEPVLVYGVGIEKRGGLPGAVRNIKVPQKPSVAVLPFLNMSGDPEQEYFSDGITEDIITDLSKISGLFVIARNSVFTYKGKSIKVEELGRELDVRYILEGSVRKVKDRVRITAQLVDAATGGHLWADRYDRDIDDIFALQDEVTRKIVSVLEVKLTVDDKTRRSCKCKYTCSMEAYDYFLRGLEHFNRFTKKTNAQARQMLEKAIAFDPEYALAHSFLGHTYLLEWSYGWSQDRRSVEKAFELAVKAVTLDFSLPQAHELLGNVYLWKKDHEQAIAELEKAVSLDPNFAAGFAGLGSVMAWAGRPEEALGMIKKAMRINPKYPDHYLWNLGHAYVLAERYEEAVSALKQVLERNPDFWPSHTLLAAAYFEMGREQEARSEAAETLKLNPDFSLDVWRQKCPFKYKETLERRFGALRKAGLQ